MPSGIRRAQRDQRREQQAGEEGECERNHGGRSPRGEAMHQETEYCNICTVNRKYYNYLIFLLNRVQSGIFGYEIGYRR